MSYPTIRTKLACLHVWPAFTYPKQRLIQLIDTCVKLLRIIISNEKFHGLSKILFQHPDADTDDMAIGKLFDSYMDLV